MPIFLRKTVRVHAVLWAQRSCAAYRCQLAGNKAANAALVEFYDGKLGPYWADRRRLVEQQYAGGLLCWLRLPNGPPNVQGWLLFKGCMSSYRLMACCEVVKDKLDSVRFEKRALREYVAILYPTLALAMLGCKHAALGRDSLGVTCVAARVLGAGMEPKAGFGMVERAQVHMSKEMSLADLVRTSASQAMRNRIHSSMLQLSKGHSPLQIGYVESWSAYASYRSKNPGTFQSPISSGQPICHATFI